MSLPQRDPSMQRTGGGVPSIRTRPTKQIALPVQFSRVRDIAYNLWWTWSPEAHSLFHMMDPSRWVHYLNPIQMLIDMEPDRWHALQNNPEFIRAYREVAAQFDAYVAPGDPTWFESRYPDYEGGPIAYFSTEYGWHESLQIYSGGLGVLSGDHSKAASDLGLPFIGIGLMYRHGYFRQTIDADGRQQHFFPDYDLHRVPLLRVLDAAGEELRVALEFPGRRVQLNVWKATVGRVPVLLLDSDVPSNHPADRPITSVLYISGREMRLCQEIVLGLGGAAVLRALGVQPGVWHMNEGHSALLALDRLRERMRTDGISFDQAREEISRDAVFTTHTPVSAGHETFDVGLIGKYFEEWSKFAGIDFDRLLELGRSPRPDAAGSFDLTTLAFRSSRRVNGVSELHAEVAREMHRPLLEEDERRRVASVTNGVHVPTWIGPEIRRVLRANLGRSIEDRLRDPGFLEAMESLDDAALWQAHSAQKRRLVLLIRERALQQFARHGCSPDELRRLDGLLDPDALLIGFARRFATYKRADLLLQDLDRLRALVGDEQRPVQFVFAGKAHPADQPGQELIRRIWQASLDGTLWGRLLFLENYDMRIARYMVQGVDVWLNNPRRPLEASGTSGMKAATNGALNCSVADGWWCEGYDPSHGWCIGDPEGEEHPEQQDRLDAENLYRLLNDEIIPCYYRRDESGLPREWIGRMKRAIGMLAPQFSAERMVREYVEHYYLPADL